MPRTVSRRRFLVGAGAAALALPALEAFEPSVAHAASTGPRLLVYYLPNGRQPLWWTPAAGNGQLTFPTQAQALQPYADQALSLVNLSNTAALASPGAAHAMGTGTVMTCRRIGTVSGGVVENDVSLDQLLVRELRPQSRFPSLQWSSGEPGPCDVGGSSCAYTQSISWTGPAKPLVPTIDPQVAFERLFGTGVDGLEGLQAEIRRSSRASVIDFVREDAQALQQRLGQADRTRMEEYFDSLRELERGLSTEGAQCEAATEPPLPGLGYADRVGAFHQLIKLAFQCDQTRFLSFMIEFGLSGRSHEFIDAPGAHHALSHFGNDTDLARLERLERWHAEQLGALLGLLRETPGSQGENLLDETIVLVIPSMGAGANHDHAGNCPLLFGGSGLVNTDGRQIAFAAAAPRPLADMHVSLLEAFGVQGSFGQSGARFGDDGTSAITGIVS